MKRLAAVCVVLIGLAVVLLTAGGGPVPHQAPVHQGRGAAAGEEAPQILLNGGSPAAPNPGDVLTSTTGTWTNSPTSYSYQWLDCGSTNNHLGGNCAPISGATSSTYTVQSSDVGFTIEVGVAACNSNGCSGISAASTSPPTGLVENPGTAPVNNTIPVITGTPQVGSTLTTSTGTWSGSPTSYSYQWQDCNSSGASCTNISGATSSTYVLTSSDVGSTVSVAVTATNTFGSSSPANAIATAVVSGTGGTGGTLGYTSIGGTCSSIGADIKAADGSFSLASSATLNSFTMYLQPTGTVGTQSVEGLLYTDNSGSPGTLVATSAPISLSNTSPAGWYSAAFPATALTSGNYWVGFIGSATGKILNHCQTTLPTGLGSVYNSNTYTSGASSPFGTANTASVEISAYVSYNSAGGGGTTPTPTAPTNLSANAGDTTVSLSWSPSTESGGSISHYEVFRNGTQIATPTGTTYTDTGLTDGTTYSYFVKAVDASNVESGASGTVQATPTAPLTGGATVAATPLGPPTPSGGWSVEFADGFGDCSINTQVGCGINAPHSDNSYWPNKCVGNGTDCTNCVANVGCGGDGSGRQESIRASQTSVESDGLHLNLTYTGGNNTPCASSPCPYLGATIETGAQPCAEGGGQGSNGLSQLTPGYSYFVYKLGEQNTVAIQAVVQFPKNTHEEDPAMWGFHDGCWRAELDEFEGYGYASAGTGANGWCNEGEALDSWWNGTNAGAGHVTGPHHDFYGDNCNSNLTGSVFDPGSALHTVTVYIHNGQQTSYLDGHDIGNSGTVGCCTNWGDMMFQAEERFLNGYTTVGDTRTLIVRSMAFYEATSDGGAFVQNPHIAPGTTIH